MVMRVATAERSVSKPASFFAAVHGLQQEGLQFLTGALGFGQRE